MPIDPALLIVMPLLMVGLGFGIAYSRRGSVVNTTIGSRRITINVPGDPAAVFARLRQMVGRYKVDDSDDQRMTVVYSSPPTFTTWGFLYPVVVHPSTVGSRIEIGIRSRFIQFGPFVSYAHNQAVESIRQLVGIPVARIARG